MLDYKALIILIKRKSENNESDEEMEGLCQRGLDTECCVFCKVIRGCACPGVERGESCAECFIKSKANVGGILDGRVLGMTCCFSLKKSCVM